MMTKIEAVKNLMSCDHGYLFPDTVKQFGEPFGYYKTVKTPNEPHIHKGLNCPGYKRGELVEGLDAMHMAMDLCKIEKVKYADFFGRGSQLAECCSRLLEHLQGKPVTSTRK